MLADVLLPAAVLAPIGAALVAAVVRGRAAVAVGLAGGLLSAVLALAVTVLVAVDGPAVHHLAGWTPPLGIALRADGMAALLLALVAIVGPVTLTAAASHPATYGEDRRFWPLALLLWAGLAGSVLAADLFNAYVALELVSLSAVGLVALGGRQAWEPAFGYLLLAVLGSLLYLVAVGAIYGLTGTLDMQDAGTALVAAPAAATRWPLALAVVGLGIKAAVLPLHSWLPPAHAAAPGAVSPLLSALVVKAAFVVLVRVWFDVLGPDPQVAVVLAWCAGAAVVVASLLALVQRSLKRVVAYSTVAQVGYLVLLFPLTSATHDPDVQRTVWAGVLLLAVAHGLAKAALFLAAGTVKLAAGTDDLDRIGGVLRSLGTTSMAMGLAAVSLVGLPTSLGFAGKWLLVSGAVRADQCWAVVLVVSGSLLSGAYLVRIVVVALREDGPDPSAGDDDPRKLHAALRHLPLGLALLVTLLGLNARWLAELSVVGAAVGGLP